MGVPAVMVDENGNRIPGEVPYDEILKHPGSPLQSRDEGLLPDAGVLRRLSQGQPAEHAERLQIHSRFYRVRRMAELKVFPAESAHVLFRGFHHLPGMPHETRPALPTTLSMGETMAPSHRIAGLAGNTAVPFYYGFDEQLQKTIEFLKSGLLECGPVRDQESGSNEMVASRWWRLGSALQT
jgi:hypothetical protein